jgi:hypothetical protein
VRRARSASRLLRRIAFHGQSMPRHGGSR